MTLEVNENILFIHCNIQHLPKTLVDMMQGPLIHELFTPHG